MVLGLLAHVTPSIFFCKILRSEVLKFIFFPEQSFYGNYATLNSHTNTVISQAFAYSSRWRRKPLQDLLLSVFGGFYASGAEDAGVNKIIAEI